MSHFELIMMTSSHMKLKCRVNKFYQNYLIAIHLVCAILLDLAGMGVETSSMPNYLLKGNKLSCSEEGQVVTIPFLQKDPCITCMCLDSEIDCFKNTCPGSLNCYHYQSNSTNCCRECRHCVLGDNFIQNGETFQHEDDICKSYHCNSGVLTQYQTQCYVPCDNPITILKQCCPSCNACPWHNTKDGEEVPYLSDRCIKCYCVKGQLICNKRVCPILPCPRSQWFKPKNSCCSVCRGSSPNSSAHVEPKSCLMENKIYQHGAQLKHDNCTTCVCNNSTFICSKQTCLSSHCAQQNHDQAIVNDSNQCCSSCAQHTHLSQQVKQTSECSYKNRHYKDGEHWQDSCRTCTCANRNVTCADVPCQNDFVCPPGYRKAKLNGSDNYCCDSCVQVIQKMEQLNDGRCSVLDDMTNITTYDAKNYRFEGKCNYVLTRDCATKRFSVHLVNKYRNSRINSSVGSVVFEGVSLMIKIEQTKIYLSHLGRVRVDSSLVHLPFIQIGQFSIVNYNDQIKLRALLGIEILWKTNKSVDIKVKSSYQDKMCGLCGNFNHDPRDEFITKNSKKRATLLKFSNSFKVGKNLLCPKSKPVRKSINGKVCAQSTWNQKLSATRACNRMKIRYPRCSGYLSASEAYQQCLTDICSCGDDKQCQCFALENFINGCNSKSRNNKFIQTSMCISHDQQCPKGAEFKFCSYNCKKTCKNRGQSVSSCHRKSCKPGCECIGNRVWHKQQCIPEVMCPFT